LQYLLGMKNTIWIVIFMIFGTDWAYANEYVPGYQRSDGTYVQGYYRTTADTRQDNNYGYQNNPNPYQPTTYNQDPHNLPFKRPDNNR